jgi:arylsulfate sulfotransferase
MKKSWFYFCLMAPLLWAGCGASSESVVSISPAAVALSVGQSIQFQATPPGSAQSLVWSVNNITGGSAMLGTIGGSGVYTAPSEPQSIAVTITARASSNSISSVSAQVFVVAPGVVEGTQNPQVCNYTIAPPAPANVSIQFGPTTSYGLSTWSQATPINGGPVSTLVAGMVANSTYHVRATLQFGNGITFTDSDHVFATGTLPADKVPTLTVTTFPGMMPQSGVELLDLVKTGTTTTKVGAAVTDLAGNLLWSYDPGLEGVSAAPIKLMANGHFLIGFGVGTVDGMDSVLQEVDLAGQLVWQMTAAQLNQALAAATCTGCNITVVGTHHDFALLPNGHLVVIASTQQLVSGTTVTGDVLIDLDQDRKPVWLWNEFDHLDINRRPYMYPDWTHTNAVLYSPDDGNLIVSIRHQNWLVKIDYANGMGSGGVLWHLGYQGDFALLNADGSTDAKPADWFYAQHGPSFVSPNTTGNFSLAVFDNGDDRDVAFAAGGTCGATGQPGCYSTVPILNIDETAMTATLTFNPTTLDYSFFGGNAEVLKNGNVEYDEASTTPSPQNNAAIFEVSQTSTPQKIWQMQIAGQYAYRGMRIPSLYPGVQW